MAKKGQKFNKYTREFKIEVVEKVISGELTQNEAARKLLGMPNNRGTISRWVDEYLSKGKDKAFMIEKRGRKENPENLSDEEFETWILKKWRSFLEEQLD